MIQKIRAEIERLKGICTTQIKANPGQTFPFVMEMTGYDKLLTFLDTLKEQPVEDLNEAAKKYAEEQFFWWIRENPYTSQEYAFKAGAEWQKEQMMKEAREAMVTTNLANRPIIYLDQLKGFQYGDKVKLIIVKED